jgi:RimJ/RimL family protein N-acetyltransferase
MTINNDKIQYPGFKIHLRKAVHADRPIIYEWMADSNLTKSMLGEPNYPDAPISSFSEFINDFSDGFFTGDNKNTGKCFIVVDENVDVGTLCYDLMNLKKRWVLLDIWLRDEKYCGKGYGSASLRLLCVYLFKKMNISNFYIAPSLRNSRAIKSYQKAGFTKLKMNRTKARNKFGTDIFDYNDNVVMKKIIKDNDKIGAC